MRHATRASTTSRTARLACATLAACVGTAPSAADDAFESWCFGGGAIADGSTTTWTVVVPPPVDPRTIESVRVRIEVAHPWTGDLAFILAHPSGAEVLLVDRPGVPSVGYPGPWGCGGRDIDAVFDGASTQPAESTCLFGVVPALQGPLRPTAPLSLLAGRAPQGVWSLRIVDAVAGDAGTLVAACIELETAPDCNANGVPDATDLENGTSVDANGDGVPDECSCLADLDHDGFVGGSDLAIVLGSWGDCADCGADLTGDDRVAGDDLAIVLSSWGACGPA